MQRISLNLWSNRAFISRCSVPSRCSAPPCPLEGANSWLSVLTLLLLLLLLDVLSDRQRPLGMGFTWLPELPWRSKSCVCRREACLRSTVGVWAVLVCFRGQLWDRTFVRTGVEGSGWTGVPKVRLTLAGDDGGMSGGDLTSGWIWGCGTGWGWGTGSVSTSGSVALIWGSSWYCSGHSGSRGLSVSCSAHVNKVDSLCSFSNSSWIGFWLPGAGPFIQEVWGGESKSKESSFIEGKEPMWWESVEDIRLKIPLLVSGGSWILTLWARLTGSLMAPLWAAALGTGQNISPFLLSWDIVSRSFRKPTPRPSSDDRTEKSTEGCFWWLFKCFWAAFWMCFLATWTAFPGLICFWAAKGWNSTWMGNLDVWWFYILPFLIDQWWQYEERWMMLPSLPGTRACNLWCKKNLILSYTTGMRQILLVLFNKCVISVTIQTLIHLFILSTWHHTGQGNCPLSDEISSNWIMIPHLKSHQRDLWHLNVEDKSLLPHWIES